MWKTATQIFIHTDMKTEKLEREEKNTKIPGSFVFNMAVLQLKIYIELTENKGGRVLQDELSEWLELCVIIGFSSRTAYVNPTWTGLLRAHAVYLYTGMLKIGKKKNTWAHTSFSRLYPTWGMDRRGSTLRRCHFTVRQRRGAGQVRYHLQMKWINISEEAAIAIIFLFSHRKLCSVLRIQDTCLTASDHRITSTLWRCQSGVTHPWISAACCISGNAAVDRRMTSGTIAFRSCLQ